MSMSRYAFSPRVNSDGIPAIGTSAISFKIYNAVLNGAIPCTFKTLTEKQRLDHIAGPLYGSADLWWVIAAASEIGWGLQVPAGTVLRIPNSIGPVLAYMR